VAIWEIRAIDRYGDRFWENVWHLDVGALEDVPPEVILALEVFHLDILLDIYSLARIVRRPAGSTDAFIEVIIEGAGHQAVGSQHALPLWNTVKLLLSGGVGRPGSKFLRGFLTDAMLTDEQNHLTSGIITVVQTAANTLFNAVSDAECNFVFGADDRPAVSPTVQTAIQMRQPHRKRKKTT